MSLHLVEETNKEHIEAEKKPTPIIELTLEADTISRTETTSNTFVPPNSIASLTCENTPKVDFPPIKRKGGRPAKMRPPTVKRKRGRPAKVRPPVTFTEPGIPASTVDAQSLVTPTPLPQLIADGDENAPAETDTSGETKVTPTGFLAGGREYALKTFPIIGHGEKLFMLANDVARLTGYRDSYLFFLRNRTLKKVVTTQTENGDLISQGVIPFSYRSRPISVVTARSIFIQFGHRVIINGQRICDDYHEEQAKKDHHVETHAKEGRELQHQAAVAATPEATTTSNTLNAHLPPLPPLAIASTTPNSDVPGTHKYPLLKARPPIFGAPRHENYQLFSASVMLKKAQGP
jgi:Chromatin remodelling complex Rsc7/Swp82 subunit